MIKRSKSAEFTVEELNKMVVDQAASREEQMEEARQMWSNPSVSLDDIVKAFGVNYQTMYRRFGPRNLSQAKREADQVSAIKNKGGRPRVGTEKQFTLARKLWNDPSLSITEITEQVGINYRTIYRELGAREVPTGRKVAPKRVLN